MNNNTSEIPLEQLRKIIYEFIKNKFDIDDMEKVINYGHDDDFGGLDCDCLTTCDCCELTYHNCYFENCICDFDCSDDCECACNFKIVDSCLHVEGDYYQTLMNYNKNILSRKTKDELLMLHNLMLMIKSKMIMNMDKENMVPFKSSGFVFTIGGRLIIFNDI